MNMRLTIQEMLLAWYKMRDAVETMQKTYEKHGSNLDKSLFGTEAGILKPFDAWIREIDSRIRDLEYLAKYKDVL